jgi:urease subunit beta/urease subunit gamma/beta
LVPYAGARRIYGHNDLANGDTETEVAKANAMKKVKEQGFKNKVS